MDHPVVTTQTKKCPACAETILAEANKCKHCGERLDKPRASGDVQARFKEALGPVLRGGFVAALKLALLCAVNAALITGYSIGAWKQQLGGNEELARLMSRSGAEVFGGMSLVIGAVLIVGMMLFVLILATLGLRKPGEEYLKGVGVAGLLAVAFLFVFRGPGRFVPVSLLAGSSLVIFVAAAAPTGRSRQVRAALGGLIFGLVFTAFLGRDDLLPPNAHSSWSNSQEWIFFGLTAVTFALLVFLPAALLGLRILLEQGDRANAS